MIKSPSPRCVIIAVPNGAGKTTFAREFLPKDTDVVHFVNADLIAAGLSARKPEIAAVTAGFETTFSGRAYATRLAKWKLAGYRIEIAYLKIDSPQIALKRIAARVKQGGHDVMSHAMSCVGALVAAGQILWASIAHWQMPGRCMIILEQRRNCWRKVLEIEYKPTTAKTERIFSSGGTGIASRRSARARNGSNARHSNLHLAKRQGRCNQAIKRVPLQVS
jgi:hypothetical protein